MHSIQLLYVQDIQELNSVSGPRVNELTCYRAEQMNEKSIQFYLPLWPLILYKLATSMTNSLERALPPMDLSGSASKVAERWRQWKRSYEYYIDGKRIT